MQHEPKETIMKTLITTLTFAAFALGATAAQASLQQSPSLSPFDRNTVLRLVPDAQLNNLTADQIRELRARVTALDRKEMPDARMTIRDIVNRG